MSELVKELRMVAERLFYESHPRDEQSLKDYNTVQHAASAIEGHAVTDGWYDMDCAPQDGTPILLFARYIHATSPVRIVGYWLPDEGWIALSFANHGIMRIVPLNWRPLPHGPALAMQPPQPTTGTE